MSVDKVIEDFFSENRKNILKWNEINHDNVNEIDFNGNELKMNLPYMYNIYIIDNEGYFRGLIDHGGYKMSDELPSFILDNKGKIIVWYNHNNPKNVQIFKMYPGARYLEEDKLKKEEVIPFVLANTEQIRKPEYKITKENSAR